MSCQRLQNSQLSDFQTQQYLSEVITQDKLKLWTCDFRLMVTLPCFFFPSFLQRDTTFVTFCLCPWITLPQWESTLNRKKMLKNFFFFKIRFHWGKFFPVRVGANHLLLELNPIEKGGKNETKMKLFSWKCTHSP